MYDVHKIFAVFSIFLILNSRTISLELISGKIYLLLLFLLFRKLSSLQGLRLYLSPLKSPTLLSILFQTKSTPNICRVNC